MRIPATFFYYLVTCQECGKEFYAHINSKNRRYCNEHNTKLATIKRAQKKAKEKKVK